MNVYVTVLIIYNLVIQKQNYRNYTSPSLTSINTYKFSLLFGSECCRQAAVNDFIDSYQGLVFIAGWKKTKLIRFVPNTISSRKGTGLRIRLA